MKSIIQIAAPVLAGAALAGASQAAQIDVTADIGPGVTTWTTNNTYNLVGQIYVRPGGTLIIQPGVVVASDPGGSLAVTRGGQIFVNGTNANPVVMTSKLDVATWAADPTHPTGKDPKTGVWREGVNEWGNLTIMGRGFVSENAIPGNVSFPDPGNVADMEGLIPAFVGDPDVRYGGGNDNDDSGSISFLSLRYGGRVVALNNELNGLSLGGIGRGTDIHHVEIMNNVDDGIEIWGGTVNLKYVSVWNIGDDSIDFDQGWRGKLQFGLIVQGYSADATQGSGVGDNMFESDGAENCNWQPVSSVVVYNATAIGQPIHGDHATAWRDNARVQYRNSVFMDVGDRLVRNDGDDGDGACGYGGGVPAGSEASTFTSLWTTPFNQYFQPNWNPALGVSMAQFYPSMVDGNMAEIRDSVFFRVPNLGDAPVDLTTGFNNVLITSVDIADGPIQSITRGAPVTKGGLTMLPVLKLDPRAKNQAATSVGMAPADGFFTPAKYRGAFDKVGNWLCGWTASDAFGFTTLAGTQTVRNGTVANPNAYLPGTQAPSIGKTWNPRIDHTSFAPAAIIDIIAVSALKTDIFVPGFGTFLCGLNPFLVLTNFAPGTPFAIPIPNQCSNIGVAACTQGASFQISGQQIVLANAIDIVIGNE